MTASEIIAWMTVVALLLYIYIAFFYRWTIKGYDGDLTGNSRYAYSYRPQVDNLRNLKLVRDLSVGDYCYVPRHALYYSGWETFVDGDYEANSEASETFNVIIEHTRSGYTATLLSYEELELEQRDLTRSAIPVRLEEEEKNYANF
jgi:hypothetical protein